MHIDEVEGIASLALEEAGLSGLPRPTPMRALSRALGLVLRPVTAPGAHAHFDGTTGMLFFNPKDPSDEDLAHENAHAAQFLAGVPPEHDENATDWIAAALRLPRRLVRSTIERVGWDPVAIVAAFPDVPSWTIWTRVSDLGAVVIARRPGRRLLWTADEAVVTEAGQPWERAYIERARALGGLYRDLFGTTVRLLGDGARARSLIVVPPDALRVVWTEETGATHGE